MIIDDGSHVPQHQYTSLKHLWTALKPGGMYMIEVGASVRVIGCLQHAVGFARTASQC